MRPSPATRGRWTTSARWPIDPAFRWLDRVILDLHFDACYFQRDKGPGLLADGADRRHRPATARSSIEGPDASRCRA